MFKYPYYENHKLKAKQNGIYIATILVVHVYLDVDGIRHFTIPITVSNPKYPTELEVSGGHNKPLTCTDVIRIQLLSSISVSMVIAVNNAWFYFNIL